MNSLITAIVVAAQLAGGTIAYADAPGPDAVDTVEVTARLRKEDAQAVPIALSVLSGDLLDATRSYNLPSLAQLAPSLNYTSPNPRNTALTIRGLGSSVVAVAQANDGLEPGVGFYVDGVYHARPATAAFDFVDLERVEILRGPQGTLFGKNTTAGALNITTRAPSYTPELRMEVAGGNYGYTQERMSASGALVDDRLAGRISFVKTDRDGVLDNITTGGENNDLDNIALRAQLLFQPRSDFSLRLSSDYAGVDANCCTQVFVGVGQTLKAASRQFPALAAGTHYTPASLDPYDRLTDIDAALRVTSHEGGASATADWNLGPITVSSISAWRFWRWNAANDRDYTALSIQTRQGIPSRQDQYSQELRIASNGVNRIDYTAGLYFFNQTIKGHPVTEYGPVAAYWLLGSAPAIPSKLLDGYRTDGYTRFFSDSYAAFGEATWHLPWRVDVSGGVRYTYEDKAGAFDSRVSGGLATSNATLISRKLSILRPQSYDAAVTDGSVSGRTMVAWHMTDDVMPYWSWSRGYKSGGINMSGLPLTPANQPALTTAAIRPEENTTVEVGAKTRWLGDRLTFNAAFFDTVVRDYQANVVDTGPGALRGYIANIDKVRVHGIEFDGALRVSPGIALYLNGAWNDGEYTSYRNAPCPLERIAATTTVCNLSGRPLPSLPKWSLSTGAEYSHPLALAGVAGNAFLRADANVRTRVFGEASDSPFAMIDGYGLVNASLGWRQARGLEVALWVRNLLAEDYLQNVTVQAGNAGLVVGTPSDPRMYGISVRLNYW